MRHPGRAPMLAVVVLVSMLTGCGYTTERTFPQQYQTVAVPTFENRTFYRGVEFDLSEAVVKQITARTPYTIAARDQADTILTGTVTGIEQETLSRRRRGGVPQQQEVTVTVDFRWENPRTGRVIRDRKGFETVGRYMPTPPVSQPFEQAQHEAVQRLAREMVDVMQAEWGETEGTGGSASDVRQRGDGTVTDAEPAGGADQ